MADKGSEPKLSSVTKDSSPKESPAPSTSPTPRPAPTYSPPPPIQLGEYPAVTIVVLMCQILAVVVLIIESVGFVSLIVGPGTFARKKAGDPNEPAVSNAPSIWSKVALLVAGAFCIAALLTFAEMVRLTARMEQRIDYIYQTR